MDRAEPRVDRDHQNDALLQAADSPTRGVPFYPSALEHGQRSERALKSAIAEL